MNIDNFRILRRLVAEESVARFDMTTWRCRTVACLGGTAEIYLGFQETNFHSIQRVEEWLGLDSRQGNYLLEARGDPGYPIEFITKDMAIRQLDHIIAEGEIADWDDVDVMNPEEAAIYARSNMGFGESSEIMSRAGGDVESCAKFYFGGIYENEEHLDMFISETRAMVGKQRPRWIARMIYEGR